MSNKCEHVWSIMEYTNFDRSYLDGKFYDSRETFFCTKCLNAKCIDREINKIGDEIIETITVVWESDVGK